MHRFYLPPAQCTGPTLQLTEGEAHHAVRVLRLGPGDPVQVLDGDGRQFDCTVSDATKTRVNLQVRETREMPRPPWQVTLVQAIPKGKLIDSIVQKATELGVHRIVPLLSERVVTHVDQAAASQKSTKWQQVAVEAIKQCGSAWLPRVEDPVRPIEFAARAEKFDLILVAALQPGSRHLRSVFESYCTREKHPPRSLCVWVGPEGDFTAAEYQMIGDTGAMPITLGHLVLRVETAAIYSLAIINHELQAAHNFTPGAQFVP